MTLMVPTTKDRDRFAAQPYFSLQTSQHDFAATIRDMKKLGTSKSRHEASRCKLNEGYPKP